MTDTTFRTLSPTEKAETSPRPVVTDKSTPQISKVEVPYLDYETEHSHPYMVDYFQLGPRWRDEMGGFASEVSTIESYFQDQISKGDMPNSIQAVKSAIQKMEKIPMFLKRKER